MTDGAMPLHVKRWLRALNLARILFDDQWYHTLYLEEIETFIRRYYVEGAKLIAHRGAQLVSRADLAQYIPPPATDTFKPVSHLELVDTLTDVMQYRSLFIDKEQYAVDKGGARLFGTFDLQWQKMEEYGAAVGFRHATDKSMSIQIAVGARVFVCDNMSFSGDLIAIRKHTSKLDLGEEMDRAMFKYIRGFRQLVDDITVQKETPLEYADSKQYIYDIFRQKIVPMRLFHPVVEDWHTMTLNKIGNVWHLHNCFTAHIKTMPPAPAFRATARLGKFFASRF